MLVAELIEKLQLMDPEARVLTREVSDYGEALEPIENVEQLDDGTVLVWA